MPLGEIWICRARNIRFHPNSSLERQILPGRIWGPWKDFTIPGGICQISPESPALIGCKNQPISGPPRGFDGDFDGGFRWEIPMEFRPRHKLARSLHFIKGVLRKRDVIFGAEMPISQNVEQNGKSRSLKKFRISGLIYSMRGVH